MKALQKHKSIQLLIGFCSSVFVLFLGIIIADVIPKTNIIGKICVFAYPIIYIVFLSLFAIICKITNLNRMYHSAFATCLVASVSSLIHWYIEESLLLLIMPFTQIFGHPIRAIAQAIENILYNTPYDFGYYAYEYYIIMGFIVFTILSSAVHQLYVDREEHAKKLEEWRLCNPARAFALGSIIGYGIYFAIFLVFYLGGNVIPDIFHRIIGTVMVVSTFTGLSFVIPVVLLSALLYNAISQAKLKNDKRQVLHPLVFLALIFIISGTVSIVQTVLSGF